MNQQKANAVLAPAQIPLDWQRPFVLRLEVRLRTEKTSYWLLLVIAALATAPLGYWLGSLVSALFPVLAGVLSSGVELPDWLLAIFAPLGIASWVASSLLTFGIGLLLPVLLIVLAVIVHSRQLAFTTRDILDGQAALMLIDEQYARLVDEERRQHYRLNINPVEYGSTFMDRLNFYTHHYLQFRHLASGPCEPRITTVIERNCWLEGVLTCLGGCLNTCVCLGSVLTIPLALRFALNWSRQLAIQQAVYDYLVGRHDDVLEERARAAERARAL